MKQLVWLVAGLTVAGAPAAAAAPALRGMETGEDFRVGPVVSAGLPLGIEEPGDRQYYSLSFQGESPNHGFSRIFLRVISLYQLLDLPALGSFQATQVRFHHQFASVGFESPLYYELTRDANFEVGWSAAFTLAKVTFKSKDKPEATGITSVFSDYPELQPSSLGAQPKANAGQADVQFLGGEFGAYARYYQWYPLVPYASLRLNLGSYFDAPALIDGVVPQTTSTTTTTTTTTATPERKYQTAMRWSPVFSAGLDLHLGGRGVIGAAFDFWNWDLLNRPVDNTYFVTIKAGFLF